MECFEGSCQIPAKLLAGQWTDDGKLDFLEALLDAGARTIDDDYEKLAEQGLMDAIKENNYRAVDLSAAESLDALYKNSDDLDTFIEPGFRDSLLDMTCDVDMNVLSCYQFAASVKPINHRRAYMVRSTTEHL